MLVKKNCVGGVMKYFHEFCRKSFYGIFICIVVLSAAAAASMSDLPSTVQAGQIMQDITAGPAHSTDGLILESGDPSINNELVEEFMKEGLESCRKGDWYGALASFESVLEIYPAHREALKYRLLCRKKLGIKPDAPPGTKPAPSRAPGSSSKPKPSSSPSNQAQENDAKRLYTDREYGFKVQIRSTWKESRQGSEIHFTSPEGDICGINLLVKSASCSQGFNECLRLLGRSLKGFSSAPSRISRSGDQETAVCAYTREGKRKGMLAFIHLYRFGFVIYGDADEGRFRTFEKAIGDALSSFTIIEPKGTVGYQKWITLKTPHFVFYALPGSNAALAASETGRTEEEAYRIITAKTGITVIRPISFFLYPDEMTLTAMTRRDSGFAMVEECEIHSLWKSRRDHQTAGHELTHIITGRGWGKPCNALIGEGIAVYLDLSGRDLYREASELMKEYGAPDIKTLAGDKWFSLRSDVAYRVSGAFCRYMAEKYGFDSLKRLYGSADFSRELEKITGKSPEQCMDDFRKTVEK